MTPHQRSSLKGRYREVWSAAYAQKFRFHEIDGHAYAATQACKMADEAVQALHDHEHPKREVKR